MTASDLVGWLEQLADADLDDVLRDWRVPSEVASIEAAAQWMRSDEAVSASLARTPSVDLTALTAGELTDSLTARGMHLIEGVSGRIPQHLEAREDAAELTEDERRLAADRAVTRTMQLSGAAASIADSPVRMTARGIPLASEQRARSAELTLDVPGWESLLDALRVAGFVDRTGKLIAVTPSGLRWLADAPEARWEALRERLLARLTLAERRLIETGAPGHLAETLPLADADTLARSARVRDDAEQLGLLQGGAPTGLQPADVGTRIPAPVHYVYLQPDLTIVAPGPLPRELEARISTMARPESRGIASSWRLTATSVQRALAAGETADGLLTVLGELSLTGVPQPVDYLVRDTERRFGDLLVQEHGGAARITTDAETQRRLLVDRSLVDIGVRVPLGAAVGDGVLLTDLPAADAVERLIEARYPALLADAAGKPVVPERVVADSPERTGLSNLTARLRGIGIDVASVEDSWLAERLTAAARAKTPVRVTVVSGTQTHRATIVPLSVANGRLRGRDVDHDLERTLPLRAITEIAGLPSSSSS